MNESDQQARTFRHALLELQRYNVVVDEPYLKVLLQVFGSQDGYLSLQCFVVSLSASDEEYSKLSDVLIKTVSQVECVPIETVKSVFESVKLRDNASFESFLREVRHRYVAPEQDTEKKSKKTPKKRDREESTSSSVTISGRNSSNCEDDEKCPICMESKRETPSMKIFDAECGHFIHLACAVQHMKWNESEKKITKCPICRQALKHKKKRKKQKTLKAHECPWKNCGKSYTRRAALVEHVNSIHLGKRIPCPWENCETYFTQQRYLVRHVNIIHLGKRISCQLCDKNYLDIRTLKQHVDSIHLKKRYDCELCGKSYTARASLWVHVNNIHRKKRYNCTLCDKSYPRNKALKQHVDSIHLKKKYNCTFCAKSYSHKYSLKRHIAKFHCPQNEARTITTTTTSNTTNRDYQNDEEIFEVAIV